MRRRRTTQSTLSTPRTFFFACFACSALIVVGSIAVSGQTPPKFDSNRAWEHLRQMVAIGPRPAGSPAIEQTRKYIKDQLAAIGLKPAEQAWDDETPLGKIHMVNLIVTIPGASRNRLAITGHYDTKLVRESGFGGASDGAWGGASLIEPARMLKMRGNPRTIALVFRDGEEAVIGWRGNAPPYGSRHYVDAARRDG